MIVYMLVDVASRGSILELRFQDNRFVAAVGWRLSLDLLLDISNELSKAS